MIAYSIDAGDDVRPRLGSRSGRQAARERRKRTARARHRTLVTGLSILGVATLVLISYLMFMAGVYRLNYDLTNLTKKTALLRERSIRLDDRIARLESRDRLATIAGQLGMGDPRRFAVATLPAPVQKPHGLAFLPFASWLR